MSRFAPIQTGNLDTRLVRGGYKYGFAQPTTGYVFMSRPGLSERVVEEISHYKNEPKWMRQLRIKALDIFEGKPMPEWGGDLSQIDFGSIHYYLRPTEKQVGSWDQVPKEIKETFERIGIPEAEREVLAGVKAQYDSEVIYGSIRKDLAKQGVIFLGMDEALQRYPDLVKEYFGRVIPAGDNKFAALNSAVWSGGSFVYVPKGVEVKFPLQAYFRINAPRAGQFERTLIIADEGARVHYIEGCSAPAYSSESLHAAVVEIFIKKGARVQYTTVQNWYKTVYNLVTKRALVQEEGEMVWTDFNMGCLTGDSLLYANPGGLVRIDSIRPGQYVYGLDFATMQPRYLLVKAMQNMGKKKVYEVMIEGRTIRATDNHPFLVLSRETRLGQKDIGSIKYFTMRWKHLADVTRDDFVAYVQRLPDDGGPYRIKYNYEFGGRAHYLKYKLVYPEKTTDELLWVLGVYIGDGCSERVSDKVWRRVSFAVPPQDRIRKKLARVLKKLFRVQPRPHGISLDLPSTAVASLFAHLGLGGNARTKRIPGWVFGLPVSQRLAFIEGCLDSDGHVHKTSHQITFTSVSNQLVKDLQLLAISCGLKTYKIRYYKIKRKLPLGREKKFYDHYQFCISKHDLPSIKNHKVVYKHAREFIGFAKPSSVRFVGVENVYDIEVEGAHNFIANGLVVHNSKLTMKYPSFILAGKGARGETLSMALAGVGQHQDTGSKAFHLAPYTSSTIVSKSISKSGGRTSYRGMVTVGPKAHGSKSKVVCDALILDEASRSDTYPTNRIMCDDVALEHEATVSKIGEEQLFYLMSRGLKEDEASKMIVSGFVEPLIKKLPLEYAVEMNRLIDLEMEGSVG